MTLMGKTRPVRARAFSVSWDKRARRAAMSPLRTACFDIFSPLPGAREVMTQVERLSSSETKIALRSVRIAACSSGRGQRVCMIAPEWVVQHLHSAREPGATNRTHRIFKGRHYEATLILQAVSWYLRYPLSYRDIEELFLERGLEVDHSTLNRWVLAYAPLIEKRLRHFRKPHCGSIRVDETYIKVRGQWRSLDRAIDKHGTPVDFLLTAKRDLEAAQRFFRKMLQEEPLLSPDRIGTDGAGSYPPAIAAARKDGLLARTPLHYVTKHLQQGIESDHFRVKRPMPRIGCFQAFHTARRTIQGFEAMLWLRKASALRETETECEQNRLLALCFGLPEVNKV